MRKILAGLVLSFFVSASWAFYVGPISVLSGPKWRITNNSVAYSDLFYVGLNASSYNYMMLDLALDPVHSPRFTVYGDLGLWAGGTGINFFTGSGTSLVNGGFHLFLIDFLASSWSCYVDSTASGTCDVYTNSSRSLGKVNIVWQ